MNLPNKLTLSRLVLTLLFLIVVFSRMRYHETVALVLFVAGGVTDLLDGQIARRYKMITNFGILMDPLADKILVCSAFIAFVGNQWVAAWMVVVVVARELAITGLRMLAASKGMVLAAERYGKHKTVSQIVAIIALLVTAAYRDWGIVGQLFAFQIAGRPWSSWFTQFALYLAVTLTFVSGGLYLWRNRQIYMDDM